MTATFAHDPGPECAWSKLDDAHDRGFNPTPDDMLPPPAHLVLADGDDWLVALAAAVEEARRLRHG